jgi:predicted nuclease with TOPRIM domain
VIEFIAVFLAVALVLTGLRLRVHRRDATRLDGVRSALLRELEIAVRERDAATAGFEAANADAGQLRAQRDQIAAENSRIREELRKSLAWRNQLRTAAEEQAYLMSRPDPHRTRAEREKDIERNAWNSRWGAIFAAPSRIPPHEQQPQDGADQ